MLTKSVFSRVPIRLPPVAFPIVTLCLSALIIAMIFAAGIRRGMDHAAAFGPEAEQTSISIALSESVYGLHLGYLGYASVRDKLVEAWNVGAKDGHDPILIKNCSNRDILNRAIKAAASLGPQPPGFIGDRTLITTVEDDMGYVDYVKLSFRLFGFHIEALYYTFFLLLSLSALAFIWTFRNSIVAQIVLLCTLSAFYVEVHTAIFNPQIPTFYGMRHGSTLALVPMWYLVFAIIERKKITLSNSIAAAVEVAIMILAFRIRGSSSWTMILVLAVAFAAAFVPWYRQPAPDRTSMNLARATAAWPALFVVGALFANIAYDDVVLHPVYFTDDVIPYHGLWHSAVLGFIVMDPDILDPDIAELAKKGTVGLDELGYRESFDYLKKSHFLAPSSRPGGLPQGYISPWTGTIKVRLDDNIMRRVFFDTVFHHPLAVARIYLWVKPRSLIENIRSVFELTPDYKWLYLIIGAGIAMGLFMVLVGGFGLERAGSTLLVYAAALFVSALPNLWAYASIQTISDIFLMLLGFLPFAIGTAIAFMFLTARRLTTGVARTTNATVQLSDIRAKQPNPQRTVGSA